MFMLIMARLFMLSIMAGWIWKSIVCLELLSKSKLPSYILEQALPVVPSQFVDSFDEIFQAGKGVIPLFVDCI